MAKILNTDDLMEIAQTEPIAQNEMEAVIDAVDRLAKKLSEHFDINSGETTWEGKAFAGLCVSFSPRTPEQPCPKPIHEGDPDGDWE